MLFFYLRKSKNVFGDNFNPWLIDPSINMFGGSSNPWLIIIDPFKNMLKEYNFAALKLSSISMVHCFQNNF